MDAIEGIYTRESYEMAYNAMNYANDVEKARKEGERDGRNERIEEKLKKVAKPADMPPTVRRSGRRSAEEEPIRRRLTHSSRESLKRSTEAWKKKVLTFILNTQKDEDFQFRQDAQNGVAVIAPCCVCYRL